MNIDLRQQPNASGFFKIEADASAFTGLTTGTRTLTIAQGGEPTITPPVVTVDAWITIIDADGSTGRSLVNIDLRQQIGEAGFFAFQVASSALAGFTSNAACTVSVS